MKSFTIRCPGMYTDKVGVVRAIRALTSMGLKESKDASERAGELQTLMIRIAQPCTDEQLFIQEQIRILRSNGVQVQGAGWHIVEELRRLGADALTQGEDELANEILQLVLAEKLRRKNI